MRYVFGSQPSLSVEQRAFLTPVIYFNHKVILKGEKTRLHTTPSLQSPSEISCVVMAEHHLDNMLLTASRDFQAFSFDFADTRGFREVARHTHAHTNSPNYLPTHLLSQHLNKLGLILSL